MSQSKISSHAPKPETDSKADHLYSEGRHARIYDRFLTQRIKAYEERFNVKITNLKELKMSFKRFETTINLNPSGSPLSTNALTPSTKKFKFGSKSRDTYFDMIVRFRFLGDTYDDPEKIKEAMDKKREAFRARHSQIKLKDGTKAIDHVSPASLSYYILW